ncbi:MAG: hypothetical protein LBO21_04520 [Synergistaceae bacterium]|jgi:hypothetical protein|nr:hypothetical protein [Synergistaceae bacterium]
MKKYLLAAASLAVMILCVTEALAWENKGVIMETDVEYSEVKVSKGGLDVRLVNTSSADVKISIRVMFRDKTGNSVGHSIIGLREIPAGGAVEISGNYLTGNWKQCRDAPRMTLEKMTYEILY